jgi:hypothetical protein
MPHPDRDRKVERLLAAARKAAPAVSSREAEEVQFFSRRVAGAWARSREKTAPPDPLCLWERVGAWSLTAATAALILVLWLHPRSPEAGPFDAFGPDAEPETPFFALAP